MRTENKNNPDQGELCGPWSVYRITDNSKVLLESDLPEEIARDMVKDYANEGVECVMEKAEPEE